MMKRIRSLTGSEEASVTSGRDAMSEEQQQYLQSLVEENKSLKDQLKQLQEQHQGLFNSAKSIEQERNGILVGLRIFTETVINTVNQRTP